MEENEVRVVKVEERRRVLGWAKGENMKCHLADPGVRVGGRIGRRRMVKGRYKEKG